MNSLVHTNNDLNTIISDNCNNINIYLLMIIVLLIFLLMIFWVYFVSYKKKPDLEMKIEKIDKTLTNLVKIFKELKKID